MGLETEFEFTLPKGYVDEGGMLHRHGTMRLATARDEIEPLRDPRVTGADDPYLTILVIARVVTALGTLRQITPNEVEGLFAADLAFLQDLYGIVNFGDPADAARLQASVLPDELPAVEVEVIDDFEEPIDLGVDAFEDDVPEPPSRRRTHIEEVGHRVES
jgi:hypothetical protein